MLLPPKKCARFFVARFVAVAVAAATATVAAATAVDPRKPCTDRRGCGVRRAVPLETVEACAHHTQSAAAWLFVRGMPHSGTTLLGRLLALHPAVAPLSNGGWYEDEGQHLQTVFAKVDDRRPEDCQGDIFRCPAMLPPKASALERRELWARLCREWLPFVESPAVIQTSPGLQRSRPMFVLEKDPDINLPFLARVADPSNSVFALYVLVCLLSIFGSPAGKFVASIC